MRGAIAGTDLRTAVLCGLKGSMAERLCGAEAITVRPEVAPGKTISSSSAEPEAVRLLGGAATIWPPKTEALGSDVFTLSEHDLGRPEITERPGRGALVFERQLTRVATALIIPIEPFFVAPTKGLGVCSALEKRP